MIRMAGHCREKCLEMNVSYNKTFSITSSMISSLHFSRNICIKKLIFTVKNSGNDDTADSLDADVLELSPQ